MASRDFSNKLKDLRLKAGYNQKEVYEHFGIPQSTFSSWEVGKSEPSGEMLIKLCEFYKCDMIKEFSSDEDLTYKEWNIIEKYRSLDQYGQETISYILDREVERIQEIKRLKKESEQIQKINSTEKFVSIRMISYYQKLASAGNGQIVFDDMAVDRIEIPDIPKYKRVSYAIGVNGKSMEPMFCDGDILLIEPTCQIEVGEIGIFIVDGEAFVKKLGIGELISLNKEYENIPLTEYSNCMGKVVDKL